VQGARLRSVEGLHVFDMDAQRLSALLASLPTLSSLSSMHLSACPGAALASIQAFMAGAARAMGCCSCLQHLDLRIQLVDKLTDQLPETFGQLLAEAHSLQWLSIEIELGSGTHRRRRWPATSMTQLMTGLAGMSQLRTLSLDVTKVVAEGTLPACMSCLVQLTSLSLSALQGLRCAPGWARLPSLACLQILSCTFAGVGEEALPGMDALVSLTSLDVRWCPSMHVLPTSLWQLTQLCCLRHGDQLRLRRSELPASCVPTSTPCFASLTRLSLPGQNLLDFPTGILAATRLTHLCLSRCRFEHLPEGISMLTALETLELGRYALSGKIGGGFDAQALGSLAGFPNLQSLTFRSCSVQFCPSIQTAAAHPRLRRLQLDSAFPAVGVSCRAFLAFVTTLLQHERPDVLVLHESIVNGRGRRDSRSFRGALRAIGFPLSKADLTSSDKDTSSDEDSSASDEE
jgi:hypothetical protein